MLLHCTVQRSRSNEESGSASELINFLECVDTSCAIIYRALLTSLECIFRYFIKQNWTDNLLNHIFVFICITTFAISGYYPLGQLLIYHIRLMTLNETTCEQAKPPNIRQIFASSKVRNILGMTVSDQPVRII